MIETVSTKLLVEMVASQKGIFSLQFTTVWIATSPNEYNDERKVKGLFFRPIEKKKRKEQTKWEDFINLKISTTEDFVVTSIVLLMVCT